MSGKRTGVSVLILALSLLWSGAALAQSLPTPPVAAPGTVQLYELTENMKLIAKHDTERRTARSELIGFAAKGSPLCPTELIAQLAAEQFIDAATFTQCTINATGSDNVKLSTGLGTLRGEFTVVVQGDNPVDSPEFVVARGRFRGDINFTTVTLYGFGTATGTFTFHDGKKIPFHGTFRVPFLYPGVPVPVYADLSTGGIVPVAPGEYAAGYPTVRFDINFY